MEYILVETDIFTKTNCHKQRAITFNNLKQAIKKFVELKDNFKFCNDLELQNMIEECSKYYYCAYEKGNFNNNHYELNIYQRKEDAKC